MVVLDLPSILSLSPEQTVVEGSEAIILCRALGNPEPIVRWEFEGKRLDSSGRLSVGSLSFFNVSSSRRGAYTCVAENVVGAARRTTQLRVIGRLVTSTFGYNTTYFYFRITEDSAN